MIPSTSDVPPGKARGKGRKRATKHGRPRGQGGGGGGNRAWRAWPHDKAGGGGEARRKRTVPGGGRACTAIGVRGTKTIMIATLENMIRNVKKHITPS